MSDEAMLVWAVLISAGQVHIIVTYLSKWLFVPSSVKGKVHYCLLVQAVSNKWFLINYGLC